MTLLQSLFEERAALTPDAVAVRTRTRQITYRALNYAADDFAARLRGQHGVGRGDVVAVALLPDVDFIVAALGTLKAGAAFLPLDPADAAERARFVVADCRAKALVAEPAVASRWQAIDIAVKEPGLTELAGVSGRRPGGTGVRPDNLAYVIYTSGSTGRPKGVAVEHRQIVASTLARRQQYPRSPGTFALLFPTAFDGAIAVIFWAFDRGACLFLPGIVREIAPAELLATGDPHRPVTDIFCVPSLYRLLLNLAPAEQLRALRRVVLGAQTCPASLTQRHFEMAPDAGLFNEYGPTEAAVWSTVYECPGPLTGRVPIGRPAPHARIEIVDDRLRPVPAGSVGELVVGGAGLARGYLNRDELTREVFTGDGQGRRYRTGDLVRQRPDGMLEFIGRLDDQVKINGFRVEPGEIENAIQDIPGVVEAAIVAVDGPTGRSLVGFVRPEQKAGFDTADVERRLGSALPAHMVPVSWLTLADFPRTPNGKADRQALKALADAASAPSRHPSSSEGPADAVEEALCAIVGEVLKISRVPPDEELFRLGADSLAVITMAAIARSRGLPLTPKEIFRHPTVRGMSGLVRERRPDREHDVRRRGSVRKGKSLT